MFKQSENNAYLGSLIATLSGLTISDWAGIFGILFGLCTVLLNWYYKDREIRLKEKALKYQIDLEKNTHVKK
ncbi:hypothetical protein A4G19_08535 [Pasteurellaceae bacterium Macca]|nr:hypothetical protein [Pasteurellaceae bacterium Macca]